ncbi:efflux RND transporter periplasmic adaptor subunit [Leisingera aquaemixtae]|uniref:efflux RND transporter periplasmic adaptor subunit n=1 Tax=Leisingera aquaemixtae TaxID=1396826 RepID=UPI001C9679FE|nr:efflux RND transporter periplasmic adaptor subunit [Leisingera aquaemixtae]MBY6065865.1 efflux RND transporter periplasmic adaptor subunit [Leisingera aquaemixtae]
MRIVPILTAVAVTASLYMVVIERDDLMAFARGEDASEAAEAGAAPAAGEKLAQAEEARVGVVAIQSKARTIGNAVILRGQTQAIRQVEVRAETTSTVISEPLRKGAHVKKGDLLCELDPGTRNASLLQAQAQLKEAKINLTAAAKLSEGGYASETRLAAAEAAERSAQAAVAAAEREIGHLTITAPFDGLLESDTAELGSLLQPGSLCGTVIQLNTIKLVGYVPEAEVNKVALGAIAQAELSTGQQVQGEVTFLSRSADPTTRTFEVEITVPNPDLSIRDGQTADIAISSAGALAHRLPQSALTLNNEGRLGVRVVGSDSTVVFYPVQLLRDEADGVWLGGLPETADVIVVGQDFVTEGVAVAATYRETEQ